MGLGERHGRHAASVPQAEATARHRRTTLLDQVRDERSLLCDVSDEASSGMEPSLANRAVLAIRAGRLLQLWDRYRNSLEDASIS